jgi:hypothetical protein
MADFMHLFAQAAAGYTIRKYKFFVQRLKKRTSDHDRMVSLSKSDPEKNIFLLWHLIVFMT